MYKCNNCDCKFETPRKVDLETYYGVYSTFGNSYGEMINLCPECEDNDITEYNEEKEEKTNPVDKLQEDLKKAIKEERYEDAAKIRDEIKKLSK